jgi:hypothetical protein
MAHVLSVLMPRGRDDFFATAHRVAENRTVAGVHYPMDNEAGRALGRSVAEYLVHRCTGSSGVDGATAVGAGNPAWFARDYAARPKADFMGVLATPETSTAISAALPVRPLAAWSWQQAVSSLA